MAGSCAKSMEFTKAEGCPPAHTRCNPWYRSLSMPLPCLSRFLCNAGFANVGTVRIQLQWLITLSRILAEILKEAKHISDTQSRWLAGLERFWILDAVLAQNSTVLSKASGSGESRIPRLARGIPSARLPQASIASV